MEVSHHANVHRFLSSMQIGGARRDGHVEASVWSRCSAGRAGEPSADVSSGWRRGAVGGCELGLEEGRRRGVGADTGSSAELCASPPWLAARAPLASFVPPSPHHGCPAELRGSLAVAGPVGRALNRRGWWRRQRWRMAASAPRACSSDEDEGGGGEDEDGDGPLCQRFCVVGLCCWRSSVFGSVTFPL